MHFLLHCQAPPVYALLRGSVRAAWLARFAGLAAAALLGLSAAQAVGSMYEAVLPAELFSSPDLCRYTDCASVLPLPAAEGAAANMPAAGKIRFGLREGSPAFIKVWRTRSGSIPADTTSAAEAGGELVGYVFLTTDTSPEIVGYSGKPIVTLVGMDARGKITGARILKHSEPILLAGIPEAKIAAYIAQYNGKPAGSRFELGRQGSGEGGAVALDAISGATVTAIAENQAVGRGAYAVARQVGLIQTVVRPAARYSADDTARDWATLVKQGAVQRLTVQPAQLGEMDTGEGLPYLDLWFGDLSVPAVGRSVLGESDYQRLIADLKNGEHALFIINQGSGSFKGSAFVRGGLYDRIRVTQDIDTYYFRDTDYRNLYRIEAAGAPTYRESGIFILRETSFSIAYPWQLSFLARRDTGADSADFIHFDAEYWLPDRFLQEGRPTLADSTHAPWEMIWRARVAEIGGMVALLLFTGAFYATHHRWTARARRSDKRWILWPHIAVWLLSVSFVGFFLLAQPSIVQALTLLHTLREGWRWDLFLSDPLIFLFWIFIAVTLLLWGRGVFCGWLCPYGGLHELLFKLAGKIGLRRWQFQPPARWHHRLRWIKYAVLAVLIAVSFDSMPLAEHLAEVEPFKSTFFIAFWQRSWPFIAYWLLLMVAALFIERPFCKYLCPLGAALAIPSRWRLFGLLRKAECTTCHACAAGCGALAINSQGRIDPTECMQCLDCMVFYYDAHACPPLAHERKRRKKADLPLTAIARDGYFIPLTRVE